LVFGSLLAFYSIFIIVQNVFLEISSPFQKKIFVGTLAGFFIVWKVFVLVITIITMVGFRNGLKDKFYPPDEDVEYKG
jgi:hypothetical protein